jgi:hypothetical protein
MTVYVRSSGFQMQAAAEAARLRVTAAARWAPAAGAEAPSQAAP